MIFNFTNLVSSLLNSFTNFRIQAISHVDSSSSLFEDTKGTDQRFGHTFSRATNVKILKRSIYFIYASLSFPLSLFNPFLSNLFTFGFEHPNIYQQELGDHQKYRAQHGIFAIDVNKEKKLKLLKATKQCCFYQSSRGTTEKTRRVVHVFSLT